MDADIDCNNLVFCSWNAGEKAADSLTPHENIPGCGSYCNDLILPVDLCVATRIYFFQSMVGIMFSVQIIRYADFFIPWSWFFCFCICPTKWGVICIFLKRIVHWIQHKKTKGIKRNEYFMTSSGILPTDMTLIQKTCHWTIWLTTSINVVIETMRMRPFH